MEPYIAQCEEYPFTRVPQRRQRVEGEATDFSRKNSARMKTQQLCGYQEHVQQRTMYSLSLSACRWW